MIRAAISQAANEILDGGSMSAIEKRWAQGTIRRPRGGVFHYWQLKSLLTNPRIAGFRQVDGQLVPAVWEAIISRTEHEEAPKRLVRATRRHARAQESLAALVRRRETEEDRLRGPRLRRSVGLSRW